MRIPTTVRTTSAAAVDCHAASAPGQVSAQPGPGMTTSSWTVASEGGFDVAECVQEWLQYRDVLAR